MNIAKKNKTTPGPRPVHPTNIRYHGLFGYTNMNQHMIVDDRWTPDSITEEYKGMTDFLTKRQKVKRLENAANRKRYSICYQALRRQCRDGRTKLQMALHGTNNLQIRNYLINHKELQRLYQNMPIEMVADNINQRTFTMRKEKDRLQYRLEQLKETYKTKLLERSRLENRLKHKDQIVSEEEIACQNYRKKIENSHVRVKAIQRINTTYHKILQILRHDSIFYEPILRSLSSDIDDQQKFIKHLLFLGMPEIAKFKELGIEFRKMEDKYRKNLQSRLSFKSHVKKENRDTGSDVTHINVASATEENEMAFTKNRYVRETRSMLLLKNRLTAETATIKQIKFSMLCSKPKEIFTRLQSQVENNRKLHNELDKTMLTHDVLKAKVKRSVVLEAVMINDLDEEQIERQNLIRTLQDTIADADQRHADIIAHMNNRANTYVVLRLSLWNLSEILRAVDRPSRVSSQPYPESYLKLPLLKFDMLTMRAVPPEAFEPHIDKMVRTIYRKVYRLMKAYDQSTSPAASAPITAEYNKLFLESYNVEESYESLGVDAYVSKQETLLESKVSLSVPNRKSVKSHSAKVVEEHLKKDE